MTREVAPEPRFRAIQMESEALLALALLPTQRIEPATLSRGQFNYWMKKTAKRLLQHTTLASESQLMRYVKLFSRAQWLAKQAAYRQRIAGLGTLQSSYWENPSEAAGSRSLADNVEFKVRENGIDLDAVRQQALQLRDQAQSVVFDSFPHEGQSILVIDNVGQAHYRGWSVSRQGVVALTEGQMLRAQLIGSPWLGETIVAANRESAEGKPATSLVTTEGLRRVDARLRTRWACGEADVAGMPEDELGGALYAVLSHEDPASVAPVLDRVWREGPDKVPTSRELNNTVVAKEWWGAVNGAGQAGGFSRS